MSVIDETICSYTGDDEILRRYAKGTLPGADAETFEEHLFECAACDRELRRAVEIRAAMTGALTAARPETESPSKLWPRLTLIAATALIAVIGLGLWQTRQPPAPFHEPVRGAETRAVAASFTMVGDTFNIKWDRHPGAQQYMVQFFAEDGALLRSIKTSDTSVTVNLSGSMGVPAFYWNVQALDADGVAIARSELQKVVRAASK